MWEWVRVHREVETAEEMERMRREGANYKPRAQREAEAKARRVHTRPAAPSFAPAQHGAVPAYPAILSQLCVRSPPPEP
jgi:hypothetical protein